ncbi:uncharacterized protein LY89DRAFT_785948 [Mollisia scopiformis]|uniref:Zn(2)-C6 fungal-type domain-containing protein n=1 Tax=Mollisia scopiformis TaxID=149040 RepID=A0A194WXH8_MOLSC|nr:uncharacterized protein LY89DRAFT_785948 [Mollisia scopiformis]KUJ12635.1 hypothetical protein LY89DRAFT_785948 [Mollisia scopiformis]
MVNTGGRSRGCSTCRRRRVKCGMIYPARIIPRLADIIRDETRPICKRCERCGLECSGAKEVRFVNQGAVSKFKRAHISARHDRAAVIPSSPDLRGFDIQVYISYTSRVLLRGGPVDLALQELHLSDIEAASDSTSDQFILHRAILSLAIIFFGTHQHVLHIQDRGYALYGKTLKQLNEVLSSPLCHLRDDVLISVVTLVLLEFFVPTGPKYYIKHILGLEKLLELRGSRMWSCKEYIPICGGIRRLLLFSSLNMRRPSILATAEWRQIPWNENTEWDQDESFLFNALADITVFQAEHDHVQQTFCAQLGSFSPQRDILVQKARRLLDELWAFKRGWNERNQRCSNRGLMSIIPILYHTALVYDLQILASLSTLPEWRENFSFAARRAALNICHYIPYLLSHKEKLDTATLTIVHLAVKSAVSTFPGKSSFARACIVSLIKSRDKGVVAKGLWID